MGSDGFQSGWNRLSSSTKRREGVYMPLLCAVRIAAGFVKSRVGAYRTGGHMIQPRRPVSRVRKK